MVTRTIDEETILMPVYKSSEDINCIYTLNKSASRIWEIINGKTTIGGIKKKILVEFDATEQEVDDAMAKVLKDLVEIKAVSIK